jgi:hypothetical protein
VAGGWVVYTFPPSGNRFYPQCVFHLLTGLDCPGCGSTRALYQLLHGNVRAAFHLNPMLFLLMFVALCGLPSALRGQRPGFVGKTWFAWSSFYVLMGWWIIRNTPLNPF